MAKQELDYEGAVELHVEKFGVEPVITGAEFWNSGDMIEKIIEAIENGEPYIEEEVSEEADI